MKHIGILPTFLTLALCLLVLSAEVNTSELNIVAAPTMTGAIQFSSATYSAAENVGSIEILLSRTGDTSASASVQYATSDTDNFTIGCSDTSGSSAFARCDFATSLDTITFAAGETSKSFSIPIVDDSLDENNETFTVTLSNPTSATLGAPSSATVTIVDNDTGTGPNPIFNSSFFVRQHYLDFLSREPDTAGFNGWVELLNGCSDLNNNPGCDRILVSSAFFGSQEFRLKGFFVYRFYKLAFNRLPTYLEIVNDMRAVTGVTANEVFQKKAAFTNAFVLRTEFANAYSGLSDASYVSTLMARYNLTQITTPDPANPDGQNKVTLTTTDLTNQVGAGTLTRAQVLRAIADSDQVSNAEFNAAFVAMQYFGYLRRTPETAGFNDWVNYLNTNPDDFRAMVNGFMNSIEYRLRFGSNTTPPPIPPTLTPQHVSLGNPGGCGSVQVTASADLSWTAVSDSAWLRITSGASGQGSGAFSYFAEQVPFGGRSMTRIGTVTVAGSAFTVSQPGHFNTRLPPTFSGVETPVGTNVMVQLPFSELGNRAAATIIYLQVTTAGLTSGGGVFPDSAQLPIGYLHFDSWGVRFATTAVISGPYTLRLIVPADTEQALFDKMRIMQNVNGVWVERATRANFQTKTLEADLTSFEDIVVAQLSPGCPPY